MPTRYWLGKKRSPETIEKMRQTKLANPTRYWLGKKRDPALIEKMRLANVGRIPWNKGTHIKINNALFEWRKRGGAIRRENHYRWNPDREALRRNQRGDPEYKQWVKAVKRRDNNTCQLKDEICEGYMIVAHIKGWALYPELRYNINNGITLCQYHHPRTRDEDKRLIPVFQTLVGSNIN